LNTFFFKMRGTVVVADAVDEGRQHVLQEHEVRCQKVLFAVVTPPCPAVNPSVLLVD
jgi:hypothetical protein